MEGEGVGKRECLLNVLCAACEHGVMRPLRFKICGLIDCAFLHGNDLVNQTYEVFRSVGRKYEQPIRGGRGMGDDELSQARPRRCV